MVAIASPIKPEQRRMPSSPSFLWIWRHCSPRRVLAKWKPVIRATSGREASPYIAQRADLVDMNEDALARTLCLVHHDVVAQGFGASRNNKECCAGSRNTNVTLFL